MDAGQKKRYAAAFMLYGAMMLWLLFDRPGRVEGIPYWEQVRMSVNLIPLATVRRYIRLLARRPGAYLIRHALVNLAGNVVMFVPLGFFLPRLFPGLGKIWKMLLLCAGIIVAVELTQLFTLVGSCDIDDLILNLLGAAMGYGLHRMTVRR